MSINISSTAEFHNFYSSKTAAIYRAIGDTAFAPDLDELCRTLIFGLWRCHTLSSQHLDIINEVYSKGQQKPTYLYWQLVSDVSDDRAITVPDFFRVLVLLDRALGKHICSDLIVLFRSLLINVCGDGDPNAETSYINTVTALFEKARSEDNIIEFKDSVSSTGSVNNTPVTLLSSSNNSTANKSESPAKEETTENPPEDLEVLLAELDSLVGMDRVKKDVRSLINLIKVRKLRDENGLSVPSLSLHMVFTGNPGTGKTTVARLLSRLYHSIGVLTKGTLVEVDRSGLVAGYVGQTAIKTQEAIEKAIGGILFIDEAYSLAPEGGSGNDFGQEAIETLLKAMEDRRSELVVIAAGYPEPMERFISSNPGLESRFGKYFHFEDYNGENLLAIFKSMCKKGEYEPDEEALAYAAELFNDMYETRDDNFGNARDVRNIFEKAVARQSDRLAAMEAPGRADLLTITKDDLVPVE